MSEDKAKGKACMNVMNVILIILGIVVAGLTIYLNKVSDVPPVLSNLKGIMSGGYLIGGLLIVLGLIGICASYGGCLLYIYCILITIDFVTNNNNKEAWKTVQDALKCCGYTGLEETGDACTADPKGPDCREFIFDQLESYCLLATIIILVVTIYVIIINCASCARWKSDCKNQ